nr:hypothetical protein [Mesorhizobium sp.]
MSPSSWRCNALDQFQKAVRDVAKLTGYPCIDIAGRRRLDRNGRHHYERGDDR